MSFYKLRYAERGVTCAECFASIQHHAKIKGRILCEGCAGPNGETWLLFDEEDDEDPSHTAEVTKVDNGCYRVSWWHEDVGQVTDVDFDSLEEAHHYLERAGYRDFTA